MAPADARSEDPFARIAPYYDALMSSVPYGVWADYVIELSRLAGRRIRPGARLLDLATGTGSVALEFASRGCSVVGVDASAPMLDEARRKAAQRHLEADFLCRDLVDFRLPPEFDHAVCLYDSLNYILDFNSLKRAFANTREALKPAGLLIFDVNTVRALEAELFTQQSAPGAAVRYRWVSHYDPDTRTSVINMHFEAPDAGGPFTLVHRQRAYTDDEIRSALEDAGLTDIRSYDGYRLREPTPVSDRVFYVARPADT